MFFNFEISSFGFFDSSMSDILKNQSVSKERIVNTYEIEFYSTSSNKLSFIDNTSIKREKGTFICAKPGQKRYSQLHNRCYFCYISSDDSNLISLLNSLPNYFSIYNIEKVVHIFEEILKCNKDTPKDQFQLQSNVTRLLAYVFSHAHNSHPETEASFYNHQKALQKTTSYIKEHLGEKLTLQKLSYVAELSPSYFHKLFCEMFNQTPSQYILDYRIAQAKVMLVSSDKSILQISEDCGFSSQSYFGMVFKKIMGCSPMEYKIQNNAATSK